jgi:hypothetical protein
VEERQALLWSVLLLFGQATDVLTTAVDRERGALEAMPISAQLLEQGGIALFWGTKLLLVAAAALVLLITARWIRFGKPGSRVVFRFALIGAQASTLGLVWVSLTNVALLASLI